MDSDAEDEDPQTGVNYEEGKVFMPYTPFSVSTGKDVHSGRDCLEETISQSYATKPNTSYQITRKRVKKVLSAAQMDAVVLACDAFGKDFAEHDCRLGFLLGDAPGVGKTYTMCGIIVETLKARNVAVRRVIWVTVSQMLFDVVKNVLRYMEYEPKSMVLNDYSHEERLPKSNRMVFTTYSTIIGTSKEVGARSRLEQLFEWARGEQFDGLIVLDECHKAKKFNVNPKLSTKVGDVVDKLQSIFPKGRILYSSATGFTGVENLSYLTRLKLWGPHTPYDDSKDLIQKLGSRGVSAMEMFAVELRSRGLYICRYLTKRGIRYRTLASEDPMICHSYSSTFWATLYSIVKLTTNNRAKRQTYWSANQRYFSAEILSSKVDLCVSEAQEGLKSNMSVIIGLQSTGETAYKKVKWHWSNLTYIIVKAVEDLCEINLERPGIVTNLKNPDYIVTGVESVTKKIAKIQRNSGAKLEDINNLFIELLKDYAVLIAHHPINPLDMIIYHLGGKRRVAELTGRTVRLKIKKGKKSAGLKVDKETRSPKKENAKGLEDFMKGKKRVIIVSDAGSIGTSLHDRRGNASYPRLHITLEWPWSADAAIQQLGRSHRSDQSTSPEYLFIVSKCAGEQRFLSSIVARLKQMGAINSGDRKANEIQMEGCLDFPLVVWKDAIHYLIDGIQAEPRTKNDLQIWDWLTKFDCFEQKPKKEELGLESNLRGPDKFLNRVLCLPINLQKVFVEKLNRYLNFVSKRFHNEYDFGIRDILIPKGAKAKILEVIEFKDIKVSLNKIRISNCLPWEPVEKLLDVDGVEMYYNQTLGPILVAGDNENIKCYRPYNCQPAIEDKKKFLQRKNLLVTDKDSFKSLWVEQYRAMKEGTCVHRYATLKGKKTSCRTNPCENGKLFYTVHILSGCVFDYWDEIESNCRRGRTAFRSARINLSEKSIIGMQIPNEFVEDILPILRKKNKEKEEQLSEVYKESDDEECSEDSKDASDNSDAENTQNAKGSEEEDSDSDSTDETLPEQENTEETINVSNPKQTSDTGSESSNSDKDTESESSTESSNSDEDKESESSSSDEDDSAYEKYDISSEEVEEGIVKKGDVNDEDEEDKEDYYEYSDDEELLSYSEESDDSIDEECSDEDKPVSKKAKFYEKSNLSEESEDEN